MQCGFHRVCCRWFFCVRKILFCSGMRECRIAAATAAVEEDGVKIKELHSAMHWVHRGCAHAAAAQLAELLVHYYCYYCCCYRRSAGAPWMHLLRSEPSSLCYFIIQSCTERWNASWFRLFRSTCWPAHLFFGKQNVHWKVVNTPNHLNWPPFHFSFLLKIWIILITFGVVLTNMPKSSIGEFFFTPPEIYINKFSFIWGSFWNIFKRLEDPFLVNLPLTFESWNNPEETWTILNNTSKTAFNVG